MPEPNGAEREMRWGRAASWARGQSFGPRAHGLPEEECKRIEDLADFLSEFGEQFAWNHYMGEVIDTNPEAPTT